MTLLAAGQPHNKAGFCLVAIVIITVSKLLWQFLDSINAYASQNRFCFVQHSMLQQRHYTC